MSTNASNSKLVLMKIGAVELKNLKAKAKVSCSKKGNKGRSSFESYHTFFQPRFNYSSSHRLPSPPPNIQPSFLHPHHPQLLLTKNNNLYPSKPTFLSDDEEVTFTEDLSVVSCEEVFGDVGEGREEGANLADGKNEVQNGMVRSEFRNKNVKIENSVSSDGSHGEGEDKNANAKKCENECETKQLDEEEEKEENNSKWDNVELVEWCVVDAIREMEGWKNVEKRLFSGLDRQFKEAILTKKRTKGDVSESKPSIGNTYPPRKSGFNFRNTNFSDSVGVAVTAAKSGGRKSSYGGFGGWGSRFKKSQINEKKKDEKVIDEEDLDETITLKVRLIFKTFLLIFLIAYYQNIRHQS